MTMTNTEIIALWENLNYKPIEQIIKTAVITKDFELYGKSNDISSLNFREKFINFGGIVKGMVSYIIPKGLEIEISVDTKNKILNLTRNGITISIKDKCSFEIIPTKLGDILFKALDYHKYKLDRAYDIMNEIEFYQELFKVNHLK